MMDLISRAYGLPWDRITDGPAWLGTDRFDVLAIVPSGVTSRSAQPMFRALLADRFKLVVHSDTRPVPVYAVVADKHTRSEEHTSELQSLRHLVCRLLLEKKKKTIETCYPVFGCPPAPNNQMCRRKS